MVSSMDCLCKWQVLILALAPLLLILNGCDDQKSGCCYKKKCSCCDGKGPSVEGSGASISNICGDRIEVKGEGAKCRIGSMSDAARAKVTNCKELDIGSMSGYSQVTIEDDMLEKFSIGSMSDASEVKLNSKAQIVKEGTKSGGSKITGGTKSSSLAELGKIVDRRNLTNSERNSSSASGLPRAWHQKPFRAKNVQQQLSLALDVKSMENVSNAKHADFLEPSSTVKENRSRIMHVF